MRKLTFLLACLFLVGVGLVHAQSKSISGKVFSVDDGQPVIGATILVRGTTQGTITDVDGNFKLNMPENAKTLVISYVGMKTLTIEAANGMVIKMESESLQMDEVVVTALGISREKKSLGYAVTEVNSTELEKSRGGVTNPVNSLVGKVAGLQISGASGQMGGSSKILIRGSKSISGNNQPLFVIDGVPVEGTDFNSVDTQRGAGGYDYGNLVQDINPDDIESISILKGPNASALYGSRATNGVVMIITKKGVKGKGLGISFNTSVGFEKVNKLPVMQKQYGGGYAFVTETINGKQYATQDYVDDESWGPKYDNSQYLSWYDLAKWEKGGKVGNPTTSTWKTPANDIDKFFELGVNFTNNLSISQSNENSSFRASYTNSTLKGYMPNSSMSKNSFNISGTAKVAKRFELFSNITYLNQAAKGRSETGYGDNNVMQKFIQWGHRDLDMVELKSLYKFPDGTQATWNRTAWDDPTPKFSNNPYWSRYMNYENDTRDRIYGNVGLKVNILSNLTFQYKTSLDFFSDKQYKRNAVNSQEESYYGDSHRQQYELNHEFLAQYNTSFNDFTLGVNAGGNIMFQRFTRLEGYSVSGLVLPEFYNLDNSRSAAKSVDYLREKGINSLFASASLGYNSLAYLDATIRNDVSSTLPKANNSYIYPSVTGSFILSELVKQDWLSFAKVRLGWAKVGNDTDPYRILDTYTFYAGYDGAPAYQLALDKNNANLKPEQTYSTEFGLEANFLNNRIGFDVTLYQSQTKNQIIPLSISGSTGYTSTIINAGVMENKGIELMFKGTPVKSKDFEWNITLTGASNKNIVKELYQDVTYYKMQSAPFKVEVGAFVGKEYGVIMGTDFIYDDKGNRVVGADGQYKSTSGNVPLGSVYPTLTGGMLNSFRYKNLDVSILFDGQTGGKYFSTSYMWGMYSGMLEETAGLNELGKEKRSDPATGGGVLVVGVNADGTPNTTRLDAETWAGSMYTGPAAQSVFRSDFIKLRELTIGYTFKLKSSMINSLKLSAYGRNLALWGPDTKHFDPESATTNSGNVQGIEGGALPSVASFGFNLGIQF